MLPLRDNHKLRSPAVVTWTLAALNLGIYLWDRGGNMLAQPTAFVDLSLKPYEFLSYFSRPDAFVLLKVFTSMFLHFNVWHLAGNLLVLMVFGPSVEQAFKGPKYALLYLVAGVAAAIAHVFVNPGSFSGLQGASGAIGGILGAYFLMFPAARIRCWVLIDTIEVPAWLLFALWFIAQLFVAQPGVANWAHVGGFVAGMVMVMAMGGRDKILAVSPVEDVAA